MDAAMCALIRWSCLLPQAPHRLQPPMPACTPDADQSWECLGLMPKDASRECLLVSTYTDMYSHSHNVQKSDAACAKCGDRGPKLRTTLFISLINTSIRYVVCCMSAISCRLSKLPVVRFGQVHCMPDQGLKRVWTLPVNPKKDSANLKILQWNVLADGLAQHGDFVKVHIPHSGSAILNLQCRLKCASGFVAHLFVTRRDSDDMSVHQVTQQALCWSSRAEKLLQQILEPQPDIVCLQEVNRYGTIATDIVQKPQHILLLHVTDRF